MNSEIVPLVDNEEISRLKEEIKIRDRILSIVSHDFRGFFSNFLWLLKIQEKNTLSKQDYEAMANEIKLNGRVNLEVLNDCFTWLEVRSESQQRTTLEEVNMRKLLEEVQLALRNKILSKRIRVQLKIDEELVVRINKTIFKFIVLKLLDNAIKYSEPEGAVGVEAQLDGDEFKLTVQDQGSGMSPEQINKIFSFEGDKFLGTLGEKGAGLSLIIVHDFVERLNGSITARSAGKNEGCSFTLILPV